MQIYIVISLPHPQVLGFPCLLVPLILKDLFATFPNLSVTLIATLNNFFAAAEPLRTAGES